MPPQKAQEMMQSWRDFDIIDVMRQMDKDAELEGNPSIVPYLLNVVSARPACRDHSQDDAAGADAP
jgi:hypothetical protein